MVSQYATLKMEKTPFSILIFDFVLVFISTVQYTVLEFEINRKILKNLKFHINIYHH
jgi:hypothetical protein